MKQSGLLLFMVLSLSLFPYSDSALLDVYVSKEIKDFEYWDVRGPSLNITHNKDYESESGDFWSQLSLTVLASLQIWWS